MHDGLDILGADNIVHHSRPPLTRTLLALGVGALGAWLIPKHRVLGFLNAAALASNGMAVYAKERTWKDASKRMGRHVVATAGSLAMPNHPAIGYVAGAVAADLLIDGEGGGMLEEFAEYEGFHKPEVIDAAYSEVPSKALVKK